MKKIKCIPPHPSCHKSDGLFKNALKRMESVYKMINSFLRMLCAV